jgi:hypothetical protein
MKMFDVNTEIIPLLTGFAIYANCLGPGLGPHSARKIFPITCPSNGCSGLHRRRSGTAVRNGAPRWTDSSCDGEFAAYVRFTDATLWPSKLDGSDRIQLTYPPLQGNRASLVAGWDANRLQRCKTVTPTGSMLFPLKAVARNRFRRGKATSILLGLKMEAR